MMRAMTVALVVMMAATTGLTQQMTNHALGRPYRVSPAPLDAYADSGGPEPHTVDAWYRGELTDGVTGPANYRAAEWVGWRDTSYREPIVVEIDLGEPVPVDRIEENVLKAVDDG